MKKLLLILGEKEMDRYKISFGTSFFTLNYCTCASHSGQNFGCKTTLCAQSSPKFFAQKYLCKCKDTYFILKNKYLRIYEDT